VAWIELPAPEQARGATAEALAAGEARYGRVLEAWRAVSLVEGAFPAYLPYLSAVVGPGHVDVVVKDLAALRVAVLLDCRYTVSHRVASARRNGVDEADILGVADPAGHGYDEPVAAALALADELTLAPATVPYRDEPQAIGPETRARLEAVFDGPQLAELALSISLWNALTRFHRVMAFDLDMPEPPPELDPAVTAG
jgi:alkylhydroperoxidase family enzyme